MSPRARAAAGEAEANSETPPADADGASPAVMEMEPPARTRSVKHTLSDEQLADFAKALVDGKWAGTGETFDGDDPEVAEKTASNKARVWRREIARYFGCEEREIRTRIWETADAGVFTCAVKLRDGSKVTLPEKNADNGDSDNDNDNDAGNGENATE